MGTPSYATRIFKALIDDKNFEITSVFTQPDKPSGRGNHLTPPDIKIFIQDNDINVKIFQPESIKNDEIVESIKSQKPDFIVVAAYGKILPLSILNIAPCINLHASLLPKYRGASPIQYAILNADKFTGITAMLMEEGLDS
ncbi:MAG: methionyl-tRNA formyltransferase, partial [Campylobacteraceae bacterium]|nr:methionyl-tRNA formyltransferase [Campylobacteraceae bacterium]